MSPSPARAGSSGRAFPAGWAKEVASPGVGNKAIALKNCRNVILRDFTIQHGGWFGILATGVDNLTIDGLKIDTNRDGMDIDCCHNVRVSNCSVNSPWDDGICLKSSFGLGQFRSTENVTISDCLVSGYDEGTLLDGTRVYTPLQERRAHRPDQVRHGVQRRVPGHHGHELRVRVLPGPGARDGGRRPPGGRHDLEHRDAPHIHGPHFPSYRRPDARAREHAGRQASRGS